MIFTALGVIINGLVFGSLLTIQITMTFISKLQKAAFIFGFTMVCTLAALPLPVQAQEDAATARDSGLFPAQGIVEIDPQMALNSETHPPLRLTPERSLILNMDEEVDRVIIGSELNINIMMDTQKRLIVVPRAPGATHFTIMGKNGKVVMQRHAIVASPKQKYVRIRESCNFGSGGCMPVRMYYCPGMCHEVAVVGEGGTAFSGSLAFEGDDSPEEGIADLNEAAGGGIGGSGNSSDDNDDTPPE